MAMNVFVIFVAVFSLWNIADANTGESLEMRIYDRDFQVSDDQMRMMLDKAALEEHGFKLEITSKLVSESGSGSEMQAYQKTYFYYKTVDCAQVPEVYKQLESLIPGALGNKLTNKTRRELSKRNLDNLNQCQAGIEVHFKEAEGCYGNKKVRVVRRKGCFICWATKAIVG